MLSVTTDPDSLNKIFSPVDAIAESCVVQFTEDGVVIPGTDGANMAIVDVKVSEHAFYDFESDGHRLGIALEKLMNVISMFDDSDEIQISLDEESELLRLEIENKQFVLGLLSHEAVPSQPNVPDVEYPIEFWTTQEILEGTVSAADLFAEKVTFQAEPGSDVVEVMARGDIDRTRIELPGRSTIGGEIKCSFKLDLLSRIVSVIPSNTEPHVKLAHDRPMVIEYSILDEHGEVHFKLAPWQDSR